MCHAMSSSLQFNRYSLSLELYVQSKVSQFSALLQKEESGLREARRLYSRYPKHCINKDTGEVTVIAPSFFSSAEEDGEEEGKGEEEEVHLEFGYDETTTFNPVDLLCPEGAESDLRHLSAAMAARKVQSQPIPYMYKPWPGRLVWLSGLRLN